MATEADDAGRLERDLAAEATIEHLRADPREAPATIRGPATTPTREADVLPGFWQSRLRLRPDAEGDVEATLVGTTSRVSSGRAVLYVHGLSDYFFQAHLADAFRTA